MVAKKVRVSVELETRWVTRRVAAHAEESPEDEETSEDSEKPEGWWGSKARVGMTP